MNVGHIIGADAYHLQAVALYNEVFGIIYRKYFFSFLLAFCFISNRHRYVDGVTNIQCIVTSDFGATWSDVIPIGVLDRSFSRFQVISNEGIDFAFHFSVSS